MPKTPLDISFEDLADAAKQASLIADREARDAGLTIAGRLAPPANDREPRKRQTRTARRA